MGQSGPKSSGVEPGCGVWACPRWPSRPGGGQSVSRGPTLQGRGQAVGDRRPDGRPRGLQGVREGVSAGTECRAAAVGQSGWMAAAVREIGVGNSHVRGGLERQSGCGQPGCGQPG